MITTTPKTASNDQLTETFNESRQSTNSPLNAPVPVNTNNPYPLRPEFYNCIQGIFVLLGRMFASIGRVFLGIFCCMRVSREVSLDQSLDHNNEGTLDQIELTDPLNRNLTELQKQKTSAVAELEALQNQVAKLNHTLKEQTITIDLNQVQLSKTQEELKAAEGQIKALELEIEAKSKVIAEHEKNEENLENSLVQVQQKLSEANQENRGLLQRLDTSEKSMDILAQNIAIKDIALLEAYKLKTPETVLQRQQSVDNSMRAARLLGKTTTDSPRVNVQTSFLMPSLLNQHDSQTQELSKNVQKWKRLVENNKLNMLSRPLTTPTQTSSNQVTDLRIPDDVNDSSKSTPTSPIKLGSHLFSIEELFDETGKNNGGGSVENQDQLNQKGPQFNEKTENNDGLSENQDRSN